MESLDSVSRVTFFTTDSCLVADLETAWRRVLDVLNDPTTPTISLREVTYASLERPDTPLGMVARGKVRSTAVICAVVLAEPDHPGNSWTEPRAPARVAVRARSLAVVGMVSAPDGVDPLDWVLGGREPFVALTNAGLAPAAAPLPAGPPPEPLTVLIGRAHVETAFALRETAVTPVLPPRGGGLARRRAIGLGELPAVAPLATNGASAGGLAVMLPVEDGLSTITPARGRWAFWRGRSV